MSITSDLRTYADSAINQSKHVLDQAQSSLTDVAGQANDIVGRALGNAGELRAAAEKAVNLDAVTTAVEPYLARLREYSTAVTDRVEHAVESARGDDRIAAVLNSAGAVGTTVRETITERVVRPVQGLTGRTGTTSGSRGTAARKPAPKPHTSTTASRSRASAAASRPAGKTAARKPAATRSTTRSATSTSASKSARKSAGSTGSARTTSS